MNTYAPTKKRKAKITHRRNNCGKTWQKSPDTDGCSLYLFSRKYHKAAI